jgi:hypothetical protein
VDEEERPQEGQETPPGAEQTDVAGSDSVAARLAVMEKELADARKENASWRTKLREQEKAQAAAQEAKLKEDKKWQELAELKEREIAEIRANVEAERLKALRLEISMKTGLDVRLAHRLVGSSPEELEADAATILSLLPKTTTADAQRPTAPNIDSGSVPPAKASHLGVSKLTAEEIKVAKSLGVTLEDYAKHKVG